MDISKQHTDMKFDVRVDYLEQDRIVKLTTFGHFDLNADRHLVAVGIESARKYRALRFLVDHRAVDIRLRMMDAEDVPMIAEQAGASPNVSIALLHGSDQPGREIFEYVDNVSYVKHGPRKTFTDEVGAIEWLRTRPG